MYNVLGVCVQSSHTLTFWKFIIAIMWVRSAAGVKLKNMKLISFSFQTSQVSARSVKVTAENVSTSPNVEAILEDFRIMGKDLVKSVETRSEKWAF